jgi:class 3 adenylate cyclase/tetratricopeptide (TPR) repeat protein
MVATMQVCPSCGERHPDRARFCMMCATPLGSGGLVEETRKVVTIVFADVTGSTAIGERLDPEAVRRVLTRFYASAREALERHGGTVEKFIGDAVMAVFGVPRVHEDDAIRGVRAAAELLEVMARMNADLAERYGAQLQLRIGVNTGEVVAGDPSSESSFVAGDAVNVAARLEQTAAPGTVFLGAETYELTRTLVEVEPVEPLTLKGKSEPVPAYRLLEVRTEPGLAGEEPSLVGRATELDALEERLATASLKRSLEHLRLVGPAGIGKTRLLLELERRTVGRARSVRCRCSPEGERAPLAPVRDLLSSALGLGATATPGDLERETRAAAGDRGRGDLVASTIRRFVDAEVTEDDAAWAVGSVLRSVASRDPLLVAVDDAHLATPALLGFLADLRSRCEDLPILWLDAYRTDHDEAAEDGAPRLEVLPLPEDESAELLAEVSPELDRGLRARIVEAAEGNPLFLLETARLVGRSPGADVGVPSGIRALVAARLETLSDAQRRAIEVAAVLGRRFLARRLDELGGGGGELVASGFLLATGDRLAFAHGTLRDVTYASTTKGRRADLHEQAAAIVEREGDPVEVLAHHLELAAGLRGELGAPDEHDRELAGRAAAALAASAERALARGDRTGAAELLPRAVALATTAGETDPSRTTVGRLAFTLGSWDDAVAMLEPLEADPVTWNPLGVALAKRGDLEPGRALLERAATAGDVDAAASLAGTWKGIDEERSAAGYLAALEIDPTDPYALGNVLEREIESSGDLSPVEDRRPAVAGATERRRRQALAGEDRPWSWFDLGKFELLLGRADESLEAFAAAVHTSTAAFMVETTARSLDRLERACAGMDGFVWARDLLALAERAVFAEGHGGAGSAWILVGGSGAEVSDRIGAYRNALVAAFEGARGTLISGGTAQGVSALAADVSRAVAGVRSVGYLPSSLPADVASDERYDELRRTEGTRFGAREPLAYWRDLLDDGVAPAEVCVIAIGGGRLSALELRIALALGASVGVVAGSGGAASELLRDPTWGTTDRLTELEPTAGALRAFLV